MANKKTAKKVATAKSAQSNKTVTAPAKSKKTVETTIMFNYLGKYHRLPLPINISSLSFSSFLQTQEGEDRIFM